MNRHHFAFRDTSPFNKALYLATAVAVLTSCGGSSSSDSETVIQGTLTQAGAEAHGNSLFISQQVVAKHSAGQRIENVEICALGECSTTDGSGQWGFATNVPGGPILFTIKGHGIDGTAIVDLPVTAQEVSIDFAHLGDSQVHVHHLTIDGQTQHLEEGDAH